MALDIATLVLDVDSSGLAKAGKALDTFERRANKAANAADGFGKKFDEGLGKAEKKTQLLEKVNQLMSGGLNKSLASAAAQFNQLALAEGKTAAEAKKLTKNYVALIGQQQLLQDQQRKIIANEKAVAKEAEKQKAITQAYKDKTDNLKEYVKWLQKGKSIEEASGRANSGQSVALIKERLRIEKELAKEIKKRQVLEAKRTASEGLYADARALNETIRLYEKGMSIEEASFRARNAHRVSDKNSITAVLDAQNRLNAAVAKRKQLEKEAQVSSDIRKEISDMVAKRKAIEGVIRTSSKAKNLREVELRLSLAQRGVSGELTEAYIRQAKALDRATNSMNRAGEAARRNANPFATIGKTLRSMFNFTIGFGFFNTIRNLVTGFYSTAVAVEQLNVALENSEGNAILAEAKFDELATRATELAIPILDTVKAFSKFSLIAKETGLSSKIVEKTFDNIIVAASGAQLEVEQFQGVMRAFEQMLSKGTVQAEELRGQLGDRLPGAFIFAAQAMGISTGELDRMLKAGQVVSAEMIPKLAERLVEVFGEAAVNRVNTLGGAVQSFRNQMTLLYKDLADAGAGDVLSFGFRQAAEGVQLLRENLELLVPAITILGTTFAGVVTAGGIALLIKALPVIAGFLGPVALGVGAVAGALVGLGTMFLGAAESSNEASAELEKFAKVREGISKSLASRADVEFIADSGDIQKITDTMGTYMESIKTLEIEKQALIETQTELADKLSDPGIFDVFFVKKNSEAYDENADALRNVNNELFNQKGLYAQLAAAIKTIPDGTDLDLTNVLAGIALETSKIEEGAEAYARYQAEIKAATTLRKSKIDVTDANIKVLADELMKQDEAREAQSRINSEREKEEELLKKIEIANTALNLVRSEGISYQEAEKRALEATLTGEEKRLATLQRTGKEEEKRNENTTRLKILKEENRLIRAGVKPLLAKKQAADKFAKSVDRVNKEYENELEINEKLVEGYEEVKKAREELEESNKKALETLRDLNSEYTNLQTGVQDQDLFEQLMGDGVDPLIISQIMEVTAALRTMQEVSELGLNLNLSPEDAAGLDIIYQRLNDISDMFAGIGGQGEEAINHILNASKTFAAASKVDAGEVFGAYTKGTALALQGVQSFVDSGSKGFKVLGLAISALNTISAIQAILNQGSGDPYSSFARMAAMAAAVASLGVQVSGTFGGGGSSTPASVSRQKTQGTGTVFGDADAKSESIANAVDITADATEALVGINSAMLNTMKGVQSGITGLSNVLIRTGVASGTPFSSVPASGTNDAGRFLAASLTGSTRLIRDFSDSIGGMIEDLTNVSLPSLSLADRFVDEVYSAFATEVTVNDRGIVILGQSFSELIDGAAVMAFQEIKRNRAGEGGISRSTEFVELTESVQSDIQSVFSGIGDVILEAAEVLGIESANALGRLNEVSFEELQISLDGLSGEEQSDALNAVFSAFADDLASAVVVFADEFAKTGEGALETVLRLANNFTVASSALDRIGQTLVNDRVGVAIATTLIEAAGGFSEFVDLTEGYISSFRNEQEQFEILTSDMTRAFNDLGITVPSTREEFRRLVDSFEVTDEESARLYSTLLSLAPVVDEVASRIEGLSDTMTDLVTSLSRTRVGLNGGSTAAFDVAVLQDAISAAETIDQVLGLIPDLASAMSDLVNEQIAAAQAFADERINALETEYDKLLDAELSLLDERQKAAEKQLELEQRLAQRAFDRQQDLEKDAFDASRQALIDAVESQTDARLDALDAEYDAVNDVIDSILELKDISKDLRDFVTSLGFDSSLGLGTPLDQLANAQREYDRLLAATRSGDVDAGGKLQGQAQTLLEIAREVFASSGAYQDIFGAVTSGLTSVADELDLISIDEQQLDAIEAQKEAIELSADDQIAAIEAQTELLALEFGYAQEDAAYAFRDSLEAQSEALNSYFQAQSDAITAATASALAAEIQKIESALAREISALEQSLSGSLGHVISGIREFSESGDLGTLKDALTASITQLANDLAVAIDAIDVNVSTTINTVTNITQEIVGIDKVPVISGEVSRDSVTNATRDGTYSGGRSGTGTLQPYATGGIFTNSVVSSPTPFNNSVMGEAGPEAVMPLTRTSAGLGVNAAGMIDLAPLIEEVRELRREMNEQDSTIALRVVTEDGRVLREEVIRDIKKRTKNGEEIVNVKGVYK